MRLDDNCIDSPRIPIRSPYGRKHHPVEFLQSRVCRLIGEQCEDDIVRCGQKCPGLGG